MIYGDVCSGISAPSVGWAGLGWAAAWYSEVEAFPSAVLAHHYPKTPNLGDMTKIHERKEFQDGPIDLLVGGTPCQSFSVAGLRKGLADPRGNLALHFLKILDLKRPRWVVWENVPGVLSSTSIDAGIQSRDFGTFLAGLRECGYGFAYRVLDAQYFGVPQRRRRVFVVGHLGDWRPATAVLFERQSLSGDPAPGRKAGEGFATDVSPSIGASGRGFERAGETRGQDPVIAHPLASKHMRHTPDTDTLIAGTLNCTGKVAGSVTQQDAEAGMLVTHSLRGEGFDASEDGTGRGTPLVFQHKQGGETQLGMSKPGCPPIRAGHQPAVVYENHAQDSRAKEVQVGPSLTAKAGTGGGNLPLVFKNREGKEGGGKGPLVSEDKAFTVATHQDQDLFHNQAVRRLTPRECERLQGFPDDYTLIPWRKGMATDGPRYKALGNSMAVPVLRWIGQRIQMVEDFKK